MRPLQGYNRAPRSWRGWSAQRQGTLVDLTPNRAHRFLPRVQRSRLTEGIAPVPGSSTPGAQSKGALGLLPIPDQCPSAQPFHPQLSRATFSARLVAALTLGSPASGIRVPIPAPRRGCASDGPGAGAESPHPPALDSARGTRKERGREETRGDQRRPGEPRPGPPAPLLPLPPRGQWLRGLGTGPGGSGPSGRKVGRRRRTEGRGGLRDTEGDRSPAGPLPAPRGGRLQRGAGSARRRAWGSGRRLSGPGGAIPASHGCRRRLGSAAPLGLPGSAGGAGSGWGRGRGRAPPGLGLGLRGPGLAPPQSDAPGAPHVALRPPGSRGEPPCPAGRTPTTLTPGAPCWRRPPTRTRTDRHADARRPADASLQRATHADLDRHTPTNVGTRTAQARVHRHAPPR